MGTPAGVAGAWRCWGSREVSAPGPGAAGGGKCVCYGSSPRLEKKELRRFFSCLFSGVN